MMVLLGLSLSPGMFSTRLLPKLKMSVKGHINILLQSLDDIS